MDYFGKRDLIYIDLVSTKDALGQLSTSADAEWSLSFHRELKLTKVFKINQ